jgi:septal ring-binding cell division protein DamX
VTEPRIIPPGSVLPPLRLVSESERGSTEPPRPDERRSEPVRATNPTSPTKPAPTSARKTDKTAKSAQRFHTINDFVDLSMRGLTGAAAKAWVVLWRDTKPNGLAKTAMSDLARRMGCSTTTAKRAVRELKAAGLLDVPVVGGLGRGASVYRVVGYVGPVEPASRGSPVIP